MHLITLARSCTRAATAMALAAAAALLPAGPAFAAEPAPVRTYASAAEIQALVAETAAALKPGQPSASRPALLLAPYRGNVEVRVGVGDATVHEDRAEFFVVIEGSGVLQSGGTLVAPVRSGPHDLRGKGLEGAAARPLAKGDMLVVPENTPHWFSRIDGRLVLLSLHVPRGGIAGAGN